TGGRVAGALGRGPTDALERDDGGGGPLGRLALGLASGAKVGGGTNARRAIDRRVAENGTRVAFQASKNGSRAKSP
ncbi:MAG: hypothetical protein FWD17_19000, partial [Polyangiaceae bacterium]|nr:hypothetical protein [Polyangiaceae bacterium]